MEEEGTEILLHPSTSGVGEIINILHYCTTEEAEDVQEEGTASRSTPVQEREPANSRRAFFPASTRAQQAPQVEPSRYDSLLEDDDGTKNNTMDKFHPALKTALYTEGQEAVWHEDQYTAISSVYVRPERKQVAPSQHSKMRVPFFKSLAKKQQVIEPTPRPVKIHIKKQKVAKAVLLLPPKEAGVGTIEEHTEVDERLMQENERHAAITESTVLARRLLDTALSGEGLDGLESERLAREAFAYAANARRIALAGSYEASSVANEEAIELENVLSYLAEEGEQAALQHVRQQVDDGSGDESSVDVDGRYANEADLTVESCASSRTGKKKRRGKFVVSAYASRAVHYLESILPKNLTDNVLEGETEEHDRSPSPQDFWSDAGISTLGLKNDTLEYGFSKDEGEEVPHERILHDKAGLLRNSDMMSISSLNEILDGGSKMSLHRSSRSEVSSPRTAVREIGIPRKEKRRPSSTRARRNRGGILGLVTPRTTRSTHSDKKQVGSDGNSSHKKWGRFFNTPRGSEIPSQLHLVVEESEEERSEGQNEESVVSLASSAASAAEKDKSSKSNEEKSVKSTPSSKVDPAARNDVAQVESDSCLGVPKNRYAPALAEEEFKDDGEKTDQYDAIPEDNKIESKNSTVSIEKDKKVAAALGVRSPLSQKEKTDTSVTSQSQSSTTFLNKSDRYRTEPIGKTPRVGAEVEQNRNREAKKGSGDIQEEEQSLSEKSLTKEAAIEKDQQNQTEIKNDSVEKGSVKEIKSADKAGNTTKDEMSTAGSEGSKSKIFGRVVGMVEQTKRKPLIPNKIVEESFIVDKDMKKISSTVKHLSKPNTAGQKVEPTPPMKAAPPMKPVSTRRTHNLVGDSNTVICKAISHGNLMANESNEEGDDVVPLNYLAVMLKQKIHKEKRNMNDSPPIREHLHEKHSEERRDADSFVAAIRGPRNKEAPGVALEEVAIRIHPSIPDPVIGNDANEIRVDLAPTPRRPANMPTTFDDDDEEEEVKDGTPENPPRNDEEDERQRRKMITERLFKAGSSSVDDEPKKETAEDTVKIAPTVESVESYEEEPVDEEENEHVVDIEKKEIPVIQPQTGRGRRRLTMSFLKRK